VHEEQVGFKRVRVRKSEKSWSPGRTPAMIFPSGTNATVRSCRMSSWVSGKTGLAWAIDVERRSVR